MPRIELSLPGTQKTRVEPFAETYRITIERGDGIACADIEAQTVMSMFCIDSFKKKARKTPRSTAAIYNLRGHVSKNGKADSILTKRRGPA